jgi:hypothetical protein
VANLEHTQITVEQIIDEAKRGSLLIPEFQRDYVWKPEQSAKLLDSLLKQFPIGSILLWEADEDSAVQARGSGGRKGRDPRWIVDGQQRSRTLLEIRESGDIDGGPAEDSNADVHFHVLEGRFSTGNKLVRADPLFVPVGSLWSEAKFAIESELVDRHYSKREVIQKNIQRCCGILSYAVPVTVMKGHAAVVAGEVFERINNGGTRVRAEDLKSAKLALNHSGFVREHLLPTLDWMQKNGITRFSLKHLFMVCEIIAGRLTRSDAKVKIWDLSPEMLAKSWSTLEAGIKATHAFVSSQFGVKDMRLLWSGALLVPPFLYFAIKKANNRDEPRLAAWLAAAALSHRYSGSVETSLELDLQAIVATDAFPGLIKNLRTSWRKSLQASPEDFAGRLQDRGALFAAYVACRHLGVVDLYTGHNMGQTVAPLHLDHIIPRSSALFERKTQADFVANMAFALDVSNRWKSDMSLGEYLKAIGARDQKRLATQCVPTDPRLWQDHKVEDFLLARRKLLAKSFNEYLSENRLAGE